MEHEFEHDFIVISPTNEIGQKGWNFPVRRVRLPSFEIFSSPSISISDIKTRRFNIIDRAVQKARDEIMAQEDADIFAALDALSGNNDE